MASIAPMIKSATNAAHEFLVRIHSPDPADRPVPDAVRVIDLLNAGSTARAARGGWIRTPALGKGPLLCARPRELSCQAVVPLVTPWLHVETIGFDGLPGQFLFHRPRLRPRRRIVDRDDILQRVGVDTRPAFDQVQVLARSLEVGLRAEIRHVDNERLALPAPPRVSPPEPDVRGEMRLCGQRNDPLPSLSLTRVVENRDGAGRLHDLAESTEIGKEAGQTALTERPVLRAVAAVDGAATDSGGRDIRRRHFISPRRWRPVLSSRAARQFPLAYIGGLQKGQLKGSEFSSSFLDFRRRGRNPAIRWIRNQRRSPAGMLQRSENRVVCPAHVLFGPTFGDARIVLPSRVRSQPVPGLPFFFRQELLVRISRGS